MVYVNTVRHIPEILCIQYYILHDDIGDAAGRNDVHLSVSDVYITSINHNVEKQHSGQSS